MIKKIYFLGIFILFFHLDKIVLCAVAENKFEVIPQKIKKPIFKPLQFEKEFSLGIEEGLIRPLFIKADNIENIYVYDFGEKCIKKFTSKGKFIEKFGKGIGQGPGEFINITDFAVKDNGEVWVCDSTFSFITIFDIYGKPVKTCRLKSPALRMSFLRTEDYIIIPTTSQNFLTFLRYDRDGELKLSFSLPPPWTEEFPELAFLKMDGWLAIDNKDNIYFAFIRSGFLASFSPEGKLRFLVETIDRTPPPKTIKSEGRILIDPKSPWAALSLSIIDSEIYILNHSSSKGRKGMVFDVYSTLDGQYLYSFEIPQKCMSACVTRSAVITVAEQETVTRWKKIF